MANENLHLGSQGTYLIQYYESCRLTAYWDSIGNVWTIGWGHTGGVYEGETITQAQADSMFASDIVTYENYVKAYITVPLLQYEFDALVSFTYNCGGGALQSSGICEDINTGNKTGAMDILMQYDHDGNGNVIQGLLNRRSVEKQLFLYDDLSSIGGSNGGGTGGTGGTGGGFTPYNGNYKVKNRYLFAATDSLFGRKFTSIQSTFNLVSQIGNMAIITDGQKQFKIPYKNLIPK